MHKWEQIRAARDAARRAPAATPEADLPIVMEVVPDWRERWLTLNDRDPAHLAARAGLLALLAAWGVFLFTRDLASGEIGQSFMHGILLVFHEAGHVIFIPFGEFMTILGGSLFQVIFPLGIGIAFMVVNRDPFAAALGLWWAGLSLVDVAPYIYDALHPQLVLLTGETGEDGPHDWIFLLRRMGQLAHAQGWGRFAHVVGGIVMLAGVAWAAAVLHRAWRGRDARHD